MIHLKKPLTREFPQSLPRASRLTFLPYSPKTSYAFDRRSQKTFIDSRLNENRLRCMWLGSGSFWRFCETKNNKGQNSLFSQCVKLQNCPKWGANLKGNHHRNKYNTIDLPLVVLNSRLRRKQCIFSSVFVARSISVQSDAKRLVHL